MSLLICAALAENSGGADTSPKTQELFAADKLAAMDAAITRAITNRQCPGGVLWLEHSGQKYHRAYGLRSASPKSETNTEETLYDAASLTKVIATTPAVMLLVERGLIQLDSPVNCYIPEFTGEGREKVTVRHLLIHASGLRAGLETRSDWKGAAAAIQKACEDKPRDPPGTVYRYSDLNFILLGEIVRRASKGSLADFAAHEIYQPLGMTNTGFLPPRSKREIIAPTTVENGTVLRGIVHDPVARRMGGVAGHSGVFTTAADLARFARMLLNGGELDGVRILQPGTVKLMTTVQTPESFSVKRGLGWDMETGHSAPRGELFSSRSYGHTGWTGTSLWIDPLPCAFVIFLSNRNHPDESGSVADLRRELGTLAAEAVGLSVTNGGGH